MIKKLRLETFFIVILVIVIASYPQFDISINNSINSINDIYFINFFIKITELGNSLWYFLIALIVFIFLLFIKKNNNIIKKIKSGCLLLPTSIIISGLITQFLKHVLGRLRPSYAIENNFFGFNFVNFDSIFHSFPSGHTSTIFSVALTLSLFIPKIKYFFLIFALTIGFSRVIVGAHFFTDVFGGIIIASAGFKIALFIFDKSKYNLNMSPIKILNDNIFFLTIIIFFITMVMVTLASDIDILISSLFFDEKNLFFLQTPDLTTFISREIFLPSLVFFILVIPILYFFLSKKNNFNIKLKTKDIYFIWITVLFNLIVFVNYLLKNLWGRARPNDIIELGGDSKFTPWFYPSNSCSVNCSFVSGDSSVGFSLIVLYFVTKNIFFLWFAIFAGFYLGFIRILAGGHFFSDIVMSGFLIFIISFIQHKIYQKKFN